MKKLIIDNKNIPKKEKNVSVNSGRNNLSIINSHLMFLLQNNDYAEIENLINEDKLKADTPIFIINLPYYIKNNMVKINQSTNEQWLTTPNYFITFANLLLIISKEKLFKKVVEKYQTENNSSNSFLFYNIPESKNQQRISNSSDYDIQEYIKLYDYLENKHVNTTAIAFHNDLPFIIEEKLKKNSLLTTKEIRIQVSRYQHQKYPLKTMSAITRYAIEQWKELKSNKKEKQLYNKLKEENEKDTIYVIIRDLSEIITSYFITKLINNNDFENYNRLAENEFPILPGITEQLNTLFIDNLSAELEDDFFKNNNNYDLQDSLLWFKLYKAFKANENNIPLEKPLSIQAIESLDSEDEMDYYEIKDTLECILEYDIINDEFHSYCKENKLDINISYNKLKFLEKNNLISYIDEEKLYNNLKELFTKSNYLQDVYKNIKKQKYLKKIISCKKDMMLKLEHDTQFITIIELQYKNKSNNSHSIVDKFIDLLKDKLKTENKTKKKIL